MVFVAPLCEEIVYRGLLWGAVERLQRRAVGGAGRHHPAVRAGPLRVHPHPAAAGRGIPIALARLYTGRLLASIVAHQVNNLLPGVALMLGLVGVIPMS